VDLWRTLVSHGMAGLPPIFLDEDARRFEVTLALPGSRPRTVRVEPGRSGFGSATVLGPKPGTRVLSAVEREVRHVLRLDEDLSGFYERAARDRRLAWVATGAGRMLRSQTVFEEVVKTVCTTNCTWSATERMVGALVEHLGEAAPTAPPTSPFGHAFPSPAVMAEAGEDFYRGVAKAGYRGAYLISLARSVASGELDLEALGRPGELPDDEVRARLLALPGVGPYAAAHVMMMLGRYRSLILDSWTRPTYAKLAGRSMTDAEIERRFRRFGPWAGLAFWLMITRSWVPEEPLAV
jgi:3-methyladenine DNA glycosylase/8-oxoguanine DNA glycosylase